MAQTPLLMYYQPSLLFLTQLWSVEMLSLTNIWFKRKAAESKACSAFRWCNYLNIFYINSKNPEQVHLLSAGCLWLLNKYICNHDTIRMVCFNPGVCMVLKTIASRPKKDPESSIPLSSSPAPVWALMGSRNFYTFYHRFCTLNAWLQVACQSIDLPTCRLWMVFVEWNREFPWLLLSTEEKLNDVG